jgi:hypothetical protein
VGTHPSKLRGDVGECPAVYIDLWLSAVSTLAFHFYAVKMVLVYIATLLQCSTTGYVFKVYGGVVAWKNHRQPTVALSTTEVEYMTSPDAVKQATWLQLLLDDLQLGPPTDSPIPIYNDNNGCIALSKNPVHHDKLKHITMRHHFLCEKVEDGSIDLSHISSASNIADLLTKSLPADTFTRLCELLGVIRLPLCGGVSESTPRSPSATLLHSV